MGLFLLRYLTIADAIAAAFFSLILARAAHLFALDTAAGTRRGGACPVPRRLHRAFSRLAAARARLVAASRRELNPWKPVVDSAWSRDRDATRRRPRAERDYLRAMPAKVEDELVSDNLSRPGGAWQFRAPASEVGMLSLEYSRPLGHVRATGTITLESVSLEKQ